MQNKIIMFFALFFIFSLDYSQAQLLMKENINNQFTEENNCKLISYEINKMDNKNIAKTFTIEVKETGDFFVYAWVMGNKRSNSIGVYLGKSIQNIFESKIEKDNWQFIKISDQSEKKSFFFNAGKNEITFITKIPEIPQVDFIVLSKNPEPPANSLFDRFIDSLKSHPIQKIKGDNPSITLDEPPFESNPEYDYDCRVNVSYSYTYWTNLYFWAGDSVTLETKKTDPYGSDPVMYLFYGPNPENGSWADDDGGIGWQSKIQITAPYTGSYYVLIRSYSQNAGQTTDLWYNDAIYNSNIPVSGYYTASSHDLTEELNYFTAYNSTGDPRIWIECSNSPHNRILYFNDNYEGPGNYDWGINARVKKAFNSSNPVRGMLLTSSSYYPTGTCDLYMGCKNAGTRQHFPNLAADDAILAQPQVSTYNCVSYAGGITNQIIWPPSSDGIDHPWWSPNPITAFDNYLGNNPPRYNGAMNYTRTGATVNNSVIDLWVNDQSYPTHTSVRKPGNNHSHGYDWESKAGEGDSRIFHDRYALQGSLYGNPSIYYKWDGTYTTFTASGNIIIAEGEGISLEESIKRGLTVMDTLQFSASEKELLDEMISILPDTTKQKLESLISSLILVPKNYKNNSFLDKDIYQNTNFYKNLLSYSQNFYPQILPYYFKEFENGKVFLKYLIDDLVKEDFENIKKDIQTENAKFKFSKNNKYIAPTINSNWIRYFKRILPLIARSGFIPKTQTNDFAQETKDKNIILRNHPNPFNNSTIISIYLPMQELVTLKVYDILGREVSTIIENERMNAGEYKLNWHGTDKNGNTLSSGIYIYRLTAGKEIISNKMQLIK